MLVDIYSSIATAATDTAGALLQAIQPSPEPKKPPSLIAKAIGWLLEPAHRSTLGQLAWVFCVVLLLCVSAAAVFGLRPFVGSYQPGIIVSVVLWSLFFGTSAFLFLPKKLITAVFGGLLGVTASETMTAAGLLSVIHSQVIKVAQQIHLILSPETSPPELPNAFITQMLWLSLILVGILCLPAFFQKD